MGCRRAFRPDAFGKSIGPEGPPTRNRLSLWRAGARCFAVNPLSCGRPRTKRPAGARARMRAIPSSAQGCAVDGTRPRPADPVGRMPTGRNVRGALSLGYFSLGKHCAAGAARTAKPATKGRRAGCPESREVTSPQGCGLNTQGRESVSPDRCNAKNRITTPATPSSPAIAPPATRGTTRPGTRSRVPT